MARARLPGSSPIETALKYGRPRRTPLSYSNRPAAKNARYGAIGSAALQRQVSQPGSDVVPRNVPLLIACWPVGTETAMSKVALSRGWSLAGNHHGAICGSLVAIVSAVEETQGRLPRCVMSPGRPLY